MASGPDQPPAGPSRLAGSLARHRWVTAAGMTATIAAVAGGGLALALHDSSAGPPKECGLVPCAAALPASVQTSGDGISQRARHGRSHGRPARARAVLAGSLPRLSRTVSGGSRGGGPGGGGPAGSARPRRTRLHTGPPLLLYDGDRLHRRGQPQSGPVQVH